MNFNHIPYTYIHLFNLASTNGSLKRKMCFTSIFSDLFPILFFNDLNSIAKILRHSQLSECKVQPFMEHNFSQNSENIQYTRVGNARSKVTQDSHSKSELYRCCVVHHFFSFTPSLMLSRTTTYISV